MTDANTHPVTEAGGRGQVLVGYDGPGRSLSLLRAAAIEAALRRTGLLVVGEAGAGRELETAAAFAAREAPEAVAVATHRLPSGPPPADDALPRAALLVVDGLSAGTGPGPVTRRLLEALDAPVLAPPAATRRPPAPTPPEPPEPAVPVVVAGVGSRSSDAEVVRSAVAEARRRGAELRLVHAWGRNPGESADHGLRRATDAVVRALCGWSATEGMPVSAVLACREPAAALVAESAEACLVVVGTDAAHAGAAGGPLARTVAARIACPVLVVRAPWRAAQLVGSP